MIGKIQPAVSFKQLYYSDRDTRDGVKLAAQNTKLREILWNGCGLINEASNNLNMGVSLEIQPRPNSQEKQSVDAYTPSGSIYEIKLDGSNNDSLTYVLAKIFDSIFINKSNEQTAPYIGRFKAAMQKPLDTTLKSCSADEFTQKLEKKFNITLHPIWN